MNILDKENIEKFSSTKEKVLQYFIAKPEKYTMHQVKEKMAHIRQMKSLNGSYIIPVIMTTTSDFYTNQEFLNYADELTKHLDWYTSTQKGTNPVETPFFETTHLQDKFGFWNFHEATGSRGTLYCKNLDQIKARHVLTKPPHGVYWKDKFGNISNKGKVQVFTNNDKEFGEENKNLMDYLFPEITNYKRPGFMNNFTDAFKSFHISKNNKYCILQITNACKNHYINNFNNNYVWRAGFQALLKTRFLSKKDSIHKNMIFLPMVYKINKRVTYSYYRDSQPVRTSSQSHNWGKSQYNDFDNSFGIIRLNTPSDIKYGPMSHEVIHCYNNKSFIQDVFVHYDKNKTGYFKDKKNTVIVYIPGDAHWGYSDVNGQLGGFSRDNLLTLHNPRSTEISTDEQKKDFKYKNYTLSGDLQSIKQSHGVYTLKDWSKFSTKTGNNRTPGKFGLLEIYSMGLISEFEFVKYLYPNSKRDNFQNKNVLTIYKNVRRFILTDYDHTKYPDDIQKDAVNDELPLVFNDITQFEEKHILLEHPVLIWLIIIAVLYLCGIIKYLYLKYKKN